MKKRYTLRAILLLASVILTTCGLQENTVPISVITVTQASPIANASATEMPSITKQPTPSPSLMPFPTLPPEEALETFIDLIDKSGDCNLPCWLGVTPGQTEFEDVENIFSEFTAIAATEFSPQWAFIKVHFPNFRTAKHSTSTEVNPAEDGKVWRILVNATAYQNINGPLDYTNPEFQKLWRRYFVPGIFTIHGPPEKIFLDTTLISADAATSYPFVLWVVYPQQGFLIRYQGNNVKAGSNIRICPMQSRIEIKIWDVNRSGYEEFTKGDRALGISTSLGPQPIESVTDYDVESFYETFKSGQVDTCFETSASIWPPN